MDNITKKIQPIIKSLLRYKLIFFLILIGLIYGYIITTSSSIVAEEPSESSISEKYKPPKRLKLDARIENKLSELENREINIDPNINRDRKNPFTR